MPVLQKGMDDLTFEGRGEGAGVGRFDFWGKGRGVGRFDFWGEGAGVGRFDFWGEGGSRTIWLLRGGGGGRMIWLLRGGGGVGRFDFWGEGDSRTIWLLRGGSGGVGRFNFWGEGGAVWRLVSARICPQLISKAGKQCLTSLVPSQLFGSFARHGRRRGYLCENEALSNQARSGLIEEDSWGRG